MSSSGYSQVNKYSPEAQRRMRHSKGKSCGYYMRIVFFFSSLIQSLIIVSLVLFLLYGKKEDLASTARIQDLEASFSQLSIENVALRQQRKNLTNLLNVTMTNKAGIEWDLKKLYNLINISAIMIPELDRKLQQCNSEVHYYRVVPQCSSDCQIRSLSNCNCGMFEQLKAKVLLVESNFTQTTQRIRNEMDQIAKERDSVTLEAIQLRRDKSIQEKELQFYKNKNKDDFFQSLSGVSNVSKAFLQKIETLFPAHIPFQLTCLKQREHLEQIRSNCSSLSREVEDKLQHYLNSVGNQVLDSQAENKHLTAENWRLTEDYRWCSHNRSSLIRENKQNLDKLQGKHDKDKERLLLDKLRLNGEIEILENNVKFKSKEVDYLKEQLRQLNMSCSSKTGFGVSTSRASPPSQSGWNLHGGGSSSASSSSSIGGGQTFRVGSVGVGSSLGSSASVFNKPISTGTGSSSSSFLLPGSNPSLSSTGSLLNKPTSTGTGSSSSSLTPGSSPSLTSTGLGLNKPGSAGGTSSSFGSAGSNPSLSSSGTSLNKPVLTTRGSSATGSSSGSVGPSPNLSLSGVSSNKPTSNVRSSTSLGSSYGSAGSTSKTGSLSSWLGIGSSNSGQSRTGSGTSHGGTGSSSGTGRTNGLAGGSTVSVAQHLQDLQRVINPPRPEDKQDLSRILG